MSGPIPTNPRALAAHPRFTTDPGVLYAELRFQQVTAKLAKADHLTLAARLEIAEQAREETSEIWAAAMALCPAVAA